MLFVSYPVSILEALSSGLSPACSLTVGANLASDSKIYNTHIYKSNGISPGIGGGGGGRGMVHVIVGSPWHTPGYIVVVVYLFTITVQAHYIHIATAVNKCAST